MLMLATLQIFVRHNFCQHCWLFGCDLGVSGENDKDKFLSIIFSSNNLVLPKIK
jgi:hypothetical protein